MYIVIHSNKSIMIVLKIGVPLIADVDPVLSLPGRVLQIVGVI